jgi:4-methyl-5(b-hydroxyethyl)-thiazole monophosphate biosynthesis
VKIVADVRIGECTGRSFDLIVLPGGMPGAERLRDSSALAELLHGQKEAGKPYGAICAAPAVALQPHGLLEGRKATTHPGFVEQLDDPSAAESRVVADGSVVTSRAPGTAIEFALALVALLYGKKKAEEVAEPMLAAGRP